MLRFHISGLSDFTLYVKSAMSDRRGRRTCTRRPTRVLPPVYPAFKGASHVCQARTTATTRGGAP